MKDLAAAVASAAPAAAASAAPILVLVGSTATGKSDLAVQIALSCPRPVEIISADSVQLYRELVIGAARPSGDALKAVRHHLVGEASVAVDFTAADFARRATEIIRAAPETAFIVVGGSGFYIQAFLRGLHPVGKGDPSIRAMLEKRADRDGTEMLYRELEAQDPEAARKIAVQDRYRIVRALEMLESLATREGTLTEMRQRFERSADVHFETLFPGRALLKAGLRLERARLEPKILSRTKSMLQQGLVAEAAGLREFWDRPALRSVGYREAVSVLRGEIDVSELEPAIVKSTLRLAKKQRTWFQRDDATQWFDAVLEQELAIGRLVDFLTESSSEASVESSMD